MTQFTVEHIWPLDPTKKGGGFKGTDGVNYYCEVGAYHMLTKGATYDAEVRPYISKMGKKSFIVDDKWHPPVTVVTNGAAAAPQPTPTPAPQTHNYANKDVLIVAQVLYKGILGSGNFGVTDLPGMRLAIVAEARAIVDACK